MADNRTMAQLLEAPTEGYEDAIVVPEITANNFEIKHGLLNLVQNKQFFGHDKEDPHAHIRYFNKITSTMKFPNVPNTSVKLMLFPFSLEGAARIWLEKEPPRSIETWDDLQKFDETFYEAWDRFNDLLRACPHHGFSELHQLDTFYNALNTNDQDSLNSAAGGNFLDKMPRECLKIIESKSKVRQSRSKAVIAKVGTSSSTPAVSSDVAELKDLVRALLLDKKNQAPAPVKAIEPSCVTCGGSGSLPGNTVTNPKEDLKGITTRSGVTTQGPTIPPTTSTSMNRDTEVTKDTMPPANNGSTKDVQPPVVQIPYPVNFTGINTCNALADLVQASIFMRIPCGRISLLSDLTPTCSNFTADFVLLGIEPDPRVPLILGRCFLKTSRALIDVYEGEITLRVGKEAITFNLDQTSRYMANFNHMTANRIDVIDMASEEYSQEVLVDPTYYDPDGDILILEAFLNNEPPTPIPNQEIVHQRPQEEIKTCEAQTVKSLIDERRS
ncbi:hypothetical protein Tco_0975056 [Tanacetum coccineum]|uniref:Retrotransposon gag domain-containing protein n=1 Tax=Tanacetum coccineum TaxID=301880 RepID=A0ABQ5EDA5_9ASTR